MSFVYDRTVSFYREAPLTSGGGGNIGYSGVTPSTRTLIAANIPASVQSPSIGANRRGPELPGDGPGPLRLNIFLPGGALPNGAIRDRDFVIDDLGETYLVAVSRFTPIGWKIQVIKEEA